MSQVIPELDIQLQIDHDLWDANNDWSKLLKLAFDAGLKEQETDGKALSVSVMLGSDEQISQLNSDWREKDTATNILSFPAPAGSRCEKGHIFLGDLIFAHETITREAIEQKKPVKNHFIHLAVHGLFHLFGDDHQTDAQAQAMENKEIRTLKRLEIANPYANHK